MQSFDARSSSWRACAVVLLALQLSACATVPGQTRAQGVLQRDVERMVLFADRARAPACTSRAVVDTLPAPMRPDEPLKVFEEWVVERCGQRLVYKVWMQPNSAIGGTDFGVTMPIDRPPPA